MKPLTNYLVPVFIQQLDQWLLKNHPNLYLNKGHIILFYVVTLNILIFLISLFWPTPSVRPTINPIFKINLFNDYFLLLFGLSIIFIFYWKYIIYKNKTVYFTSNILSNLFILLYQMAILGILFGLSLFTFQIGGVIRTAYFTMDNRDVKAIQEAGYFSYGIILEDRLVNDSLSNITDTLSIIKEGEKMFRSYIEKEDRILDSRYDTTFTQLFDSTFFNWKLLHLSLAAKVDTIFASNLLSRSYSSTWSFSVDLQNLNEYIESPNYINSKITFPFSLSEKNYYLYRSYMVSADTSNYSYRSYSTNKSYQAELFGNGFDSLETDIFFNRLTTLQKKYENLYYTHTLNKNNLKSFIKKYEIPFQIDTIAYLDITFHVPRHVYQLEDLTRSVLNSRQFLSEWIILRYLKGLIFFFPLVFWALLLSGLPFFSFRRFWEALSVFLALAISFYILETYLGADTGALFAMGVFVIPEVMLLITMVHTLIKSQRSSLLNLLFHLHLITLSLIIAFFFFEPAQNYYRNLQSITSGDSKVFFILLIIPIITFLWYPKLHAMPER